MSASALLSEKIPLDFAIIRAGCEDSAAINALAHRIWPVCYEGILTDEQIANMLGAIYDIKALEAQMAEGQEFWLLEVSGKACGYASVIPGKDEILLKKLYLAPDLQGKGLGRTMCEHIIAEYPFAKHVCLYVNKDNLNAQRFYERIGFYKSGSERVRMGDFEFTDFIYIKEL